MHDESTEFNRQAWDRIAAKKDQWFHGATSEQLNLAKQGEWDLKVTPIKNVPQHWFGDVNGRSILGLACGGGLQGPILAAAGADVTVVDNSQAQLNRDREIAAANNIQLKTQIADMRDLSVFADSSFHLVLNPTSVCYVKSVREIWAECYRVLKPGGILISGSINPINYLFDASLRDKNQLVARHKIPYSDLQLTADQRKQIVGPLRPIEFGHSLQSLIGAQLDSGFQLTGFYTDKWGDRDELSRRIDCFIATHSVKPSSPSS